MTDRPSSHQPPTPQEIYMRRRVAALAILLAVVVLVIWALTAFARSGSNDAEETTTAPPTTLVTTPTEPEPSASSTQTSTEATESTEPSESKPENPDAAALAEKKTCELDDLQLTVRSDQPNYPAEGDGAQPSLTVQIHNPTGGDCVINTDEQPLRFSVYQIGHEGFQPVWSDTDCHEPVIKGEQTFRAGESRNFNAKWSRLASAPEQCNDRQPVPAGAYVTIATLGDKASESATFNLG